MTFENWFYELEGFGLRAERFYAGVDPDCRIDTEYLVNWLRAAYEAGVNDTLYRYTDDLR